VALENVVFQLRQAEQEVLGGDVFILEVVSRFEGCIEKLAQRIADERFGRRTADLGVLGDLGRGLGLDRAGVQSEFVDDRRDDAAILAKQRDEQVRGGDFGVAGAAGEVLRFDHRLLGFDCKLVEIHGLPRIESQRLNF
jgi:hypothetical protein